MIRAKVLGVSLKADVLTGHGLKLKQDAEGHLIMRNVGEIEVTVAAGRVEAEPDFCTILQPGQQTGFLPHKGEHMLMICHDGDEPVITKAEEALNLPPSSLGCEGHKLTFEIVED